ncbi:16S rRNA (adenine(1518)-N(6)/adenine(1519)-N(6))-dimethyltransferase RsmA [Chloroflexota bacterium]
MTLPPLDIPTILQRYNLRPDKRLGQNFLIDQSALEGVIEAADVQKSDVVLEIGAGVGSLTRLLAIHARNVLAVELDSKLIPPLEEVISGFQNVEIIQGDILRLNLNQLMNISGFLVVANIPYYITSTLIRNLLETIRPPKRLVLTLQCEVAERICASPGKMSVLALSVQVYGKPDIMSYIPSAAFYPQPNVDSAILRIDRYLEPQIPIGLIPTFFRLVKAGFSQKRKTLRNSMAGGMRWKPAQSEAILYQSGINSIRRAETLSLEEWGELADIVNKLENEATLKLNSNNGS